MTKPRRTTPITATRAVFRALFLTVRAVFAAGVGAAVLAGIPYTLIRFIGWPLPHRLPSLSRLKTDLTSPILGDQFYLNAIAIVLWFLWAMLAVSVLVELGAQFRRVPAPHLPAMGPAQQIAAALLLAIGITALLGRTAAPARADTSTVVPKARTAATAPTLISTPTGLHQVATIPTRETVHHVVPGDSLYKIAQADLGDGEDWPALYKANAGVVQHDGQRLTDPNLIQPGWDITIPGATTTPEAAAPAPAAVPSPSAPAVTDPAHAVPAVPTTTPSHAGRSAVPVTPAAPALATPSARASAPAAPAHSTGDGHHTAAPTARPARSGTAGSRLWIELAGGGVIAASTLLALRAAAARRHKLRALWTSPFWPRPGEHRTLSTDQLPPALLPARTIALTPTDPGSEDSTGVGELDAFGAPADASATEEPLGTETLAPHDAERDDHVSETPPLDLPTADVTDDADEAGDPAWIPVAVAGDGGSLDLADLLDGLGLTGPGALGTARAIAATVLGSRSPDEFGSILLIPRADAALLLDVPAAEVDRLARDVWHLRITDDLPRAIDILAEHAAARAGMLAEYGVAHFEALGEIDDLLPDPEPVVLLAVARGALDTQAKTVLDQPEALRLHSVLLGEHPIGASWRIDADGEVVSGTDEPEVFAFGLSAAGLRSALDVVTPPWDERPQIEAPDPHGPLAAPRGVSDTPDDEEEDGDAATEAAVAGAPLAAATRAQADDECPGADVIAASDETQPATSRLAIPTETDEDDEHEGAAQVNAESPIADEPAILDAEQQARHLGPVDAAEAAVPLPAPVLIAGRTPAGPPATEAGAEFEQVKEVLRQFGSTASQIRVLGPLRVVTVSGSVDDKIRKGSLKLAALLGLHHGRGRSTEELSVLWPDATEAKLPHTRKNDLQSLRNSLKRDVLQGRGTGYAAEFIPRRAGRYRLDPHFVGVDLAAFEQLRALAARTHQPEVRKAAAEAALSLYRGELLEGMDEHWAIAPRAAVRRDALATATLLAQLAAEAGDDELALSWWEQARQIDDNEEVYRQIMLVQGRLGRRADIIATRDLLEQRLDALGESASEATNMILAELLSERRGLPRERAA